MKRLLLLVGVLGAATVVVAKLFRPGEGNIRSAAGRAAETVPEKAPGFSESAAQGIEELGEAAEKGAQEVRERESDAQEEPSEEEPPRQA